MRVTITFKLEAESRGELIDTFAASARDFKDTIEETARRMGGFAGIPASHLQFRWLLIGGQWNPVAPAAPLVIEAPATLTQCTLPPPGWRCTRKPGHDGPCAAWPVTDSHVAH